MKLLIYYLVAENRIDRMMSTLASQRAILPAWEKVEKLFVVDRDVTARFPSEGSNRVVRMNLFSSSGLFLFSKAKNAAIAYAVAHGFDWLLDCDADTVLLRLPKEMPSTGYGCVPCHFVKQGAELFLYNAEDIIPHLEFQGSSRFLTRRDVFEKHRYFEGFEGYGGEDIDYHENVLAYNGVHQSPTDARCFHFWHPTNHRPMNDPELLERRRRAHVR